MPLFSANDRADEVWTAHILRVWPHLQAVIDAAINRAKRGEVGMGLKTLFGKMSTSMKGEGSPSVEELWDLYREKERKRRAEENEARERASKATDQAREESHDDEYDDDEAEEEEEETTTTPRSLEELMVELKDVFMLIKVGWQQQRA